MNVILEGKLIDVISKEYDFEGQKGISHKLVIYKDGKTFNVTISAKRLREFTDLIGQEVEVKCNIYIKGSYNLKINE